MRVAGTKSCSFSARACSWEGEARVGFACRRQEPLLLEPCPPAPVLPGPALRRPGGGGLEPAAGPKACVSGPGWRAGRGACTRSFPAVGVGKRLRPDVEGPRLGGGPSSHSLCRGRSGTPRSEQLQEAWERLRADGRLSTDGAGPMGPSGDLARRWPSRTGAPAADGHGLLWEKVLPSILGPASAGLGAAGRAPSIPPAAAGCSPPARRQHPQAS